VVNVKGIIANVKKLRIFLFFYWFNPLLILNIVLNNYIAAKAAKAAMRVAIANLTTIGS
jgi:hypothetical protein